MLQKYITAVCGARDLVIIDFLKLFYLALICKLYKNCLTYCCVLLTFKGLFLPHLIGGVVALLKGCCCCCCCSGSCSHSHPCLLRLILHSCPPPPLKSAP